MHWFLWCCESRCSDIDDWCWLMTTSIVFCGTYSILLCSLCASSHHQWMVFWNSWMRSSSRSVTKCKYSSQPLLLTVAVTMTMTAPYVDMLSEVVNITCCGFALSLTRYVGCVSSGITCTAKEVLKLWPGSSRMYKVGINLTALLTVYCHCHCHVMSGHPIFHQSLCLSGIQVSHFHQFWPNWTSGTSISGCWWVSADVFFSYYIYIIFHCVMLFTSPHIFFLCVARMWKALRWRWLLYIPSKAIHDGMECMYPLHAPPLLIAIIYYLSFAVIHLLIFCCCVCVCVALFMIYLDECLGRHRLQQSTSRRHPCGDQS